MSNPEKFPSYQDMYSVNGDTYRFADPFNNRQVVEPGEVPTWLLQDSLLASGVNFLRNQGEKVQVKIGLARDTQTDAEDLGSLRTGLYEQHVEEADLYGFEHFGFSPTAFGEWIVAAGSNNPAIVNARNFPDRTKRLNLFTDECQRLGYGSIVEDGYVARRAMMIATSLRDKFNKPVFSHSVRGNDASTQTRMETYLMNVKRAIDAAAAQPLIEQRQHGLSEPSAALISMLDKSQWISVAHTGLEAFKRRSLLGPKTPPELTIFLEAGQHAGHLAAKFTALDVGAELVELAEPGFTQMLNVQGMMERGGVTSNEVVLLDDLLDQRVARFVR
jgi:hypothetical protein